MNDVYALYRDDVNIEEVEEFIRVEKEKSSLKLEEKAKEREIRKEKLKIEEGITSGKKEITGPSLESVKETSTDISKEIAIIILLVIVAIVFGKKLYNQLKSKPK